jgi:TolB protein
MPNRTKHLLPFTLAVLASVLSIQPVSLAQDAPQPTAILGFTLGKPGRKDVPIALPLPKGDNDATNRELWSTVKRDLEISGWFSVIDPNAYVEPSSAGIKPGEFSFDNWKVPGASVLAKTSVAADASSVRGEVWIYDVNGANKLDARAYSAGATGTRNVAHRVSNAIIKAVTGEDSIFNSRFAAVNSRTGNKEIYLVDVDGFGALPVTRNGSINLQPSWKPTGDALLFTSYRSGNPDLYVADLAKGTTRRLSARRGLNIGGAWSPRGNAIALTLSNGGNSDVYLIDPVVGDEVAQLTSEPGIDTSPAWSPDGSQLAFVSDRSGGAQVYIMSASGGGARRVTFSGSYNTDPTWSPKGDRLAFVGRDSHFDVFTVGTDGRGISRVTQGMGDNEDPTWSPDGQYLAFSSNRTGANHIWVATADGDHQIQITLDKGGWTNPAWSPSLGW